MARNLTTPQRDLLREGNLDARLLSTWWMDAGVYRYCDNHDDMTDGVNTWMGANAIAGASEIRSGAGFAAEQVTIKLDGTRMLQTGFTDPVELFNMILSEDLHNRRVDLAIALRRPEEELITMILSLYSGLINHAKLVDPRMDFEESGDPIVPNLEIVLDSIAVRYNWATGRTRSHEDQLEIDPTDKFFSFTQGIQKTEQVLYWGMNAPRTVGGGGGTTSWGGSGSGNHPTTNYK